MALSALVKGVEIEDKAALIEKRAKDKERFPFKNFGIK